MAMFMVLMMSVLGIGILRLAEVDALETSAVLNRTRAFWFAEAGLQEFQAIVENPSNRIPLEDLRVNDRDFVSDAALSCSFGDGGRYWVDVQQVVAARLYRITSTGVTVSGETKSVTQLVQANRFSDRIWSTHSEETASGGNIYFAPGDRINGEVYSNDRLNIYGNPEFLKLVRSAANSINYWDTRPDNWIDPSVFTAGLLLGQPVLDFGDIEDHILNISNRANFSLPSGDYNIVIDGMRIITENRSSGDVLTNNLSAGSIIHALGNVFVEGTVAMPLSIVTDQAIIITDDLICSSTLSNPNHSSPGFSPASNEVLGLFSGSQVRIQSGVGEVNIHASIFITKDNIQSNDNGFWAEDRYQNIGAPYINLFGSISQYRRGIIGQMGGVGYLKNYGYDERLLVTAPPGIPISDYSSRAWEQL